VPDVDPIEIDVSRIRRDIADKRKNQDVMFDVRIVAVPQDGAEAIAYVIRWAELQSSGPYLTKTRAELATCAVALPADVDTAAVAREMGLHPQIKE
jgi:hypothetical protein